MSKAQCLNCQDIIESKHRHDFVRCRCGNSFLDGGDDYIRAGGAISILGDSGRVSPMELFLKDSEPIVAFNRDEALQELLSDVDIDDMFDDDSFLDDDFDDYNLGYQAGTQDERERILKIINDYRHKPTFGYANLISLIKGDSNG